MHGPDLDDNGRPIDYPWDTPDHNSRPESEYPDPPEPDEPEEPEPFIPAVEPLDEDDEEEEVDENEWGTPERLIRYADPIPTGVLGPVLGPMVDAVTVAFQVPSDIAVTMALPLITCAAAGRWTVYVHDDWSETLALAAISVLISSGGKSPTLNALARPLREFAKQERDGAKPLIARETARHQMLADAAEKLRKKVANLDDAAADGTRKAAENATVRRSYEAAVEALDAHRVPVEPRFIVDDITPEALGTVLAEQDGAVGIVSPEAGILQTLGGRYAAGVVNLDTVLKANSGDPISIKRKSSPDVDIDSPALSISLAAQPGLMGRLADKPEFRESGFLGRFLPVMPRATMGYRDLHPPLIPPEVTSAWVHGIRSLAHKALELRGADEHRVLPLTDDAHVVLDEFRAYIEPQFREGGPMETMWDFGGKLAGKAIRIAGALTLLADADAEVITAETMRGAVTAADAYIDHAYALFALIGGATPADPMARIVDWIKEQGQPTVSHRDIHRAFKAKPWARTAKDVMGLMLGLADKGYVRKDQRVPPGGRGGRPSTVWDVNPTLLGTEPPREIVG